ncbi:MAG: hypothetical protein ABSG53_08250 [Thermoguttaceae bacterium]|jgi:hypothetical protein
MNIRQDLPRYDLLLVAADLEERRLLFAELQEAGYGVLPAPGLLPAVQTVFLRLVAPPLILVDTQSDKYATPEHMEELFQLAPGVPVILLISGIGGAAWKPLEPRLTALLHRPIRIGEVVDVVRHTLGCPDPRPSCCRVGPGNGGPVPSRHRCDNSMLDCRTEHWRAP